MMHHDYFYGSLGGMGGGWVIYIFCLAFPCVCVCVGGGGGGQNPIIDTRQGTTGCNKSSIELMLSLSYMGC